MTGSIWTTTRHGEDTVVSYLSGWRISHTPGARLAEIHSPAGELLDAVQVVDWDWAPAEGGPSRAASVAVPDDLANALAEWVEGNAEGLGLPPL